MVTKELSMKTHSAVGDKHVSTAKAMKIKNRVPIGKPSGTPTARMLRGTRSASVNTGSNPSRGANPRVSNQNLPFSKSSPKATDKVSRKMASMALGLSGLASRRGKAINNQKVRPEQDQAAQVPQQMSR